MRRLIAAAALISSCIMLQAQDKVVFNPKGHEVVTTDRQDGRYLSTYGALHQRLKEVKPEYAYKMGMSGKEFAKWQKGLSQKMKDVMRLPGATYIPKELKEWQATTAVQPAPLRLEAIQRDGYVQEKWEFYPLEDVVSTFYMLIPDGTDEPRPAVMCIPGSGGDKETLIGVRKDGSLILDKPRSTMALDMVKEGYIAIAVDNACAGEAADLEPLTEDWWDYDYVVSSRILLELGWSWLGYTSYLNDQILEWMKKQPSIDAKKIVISGFSLGTEPMMVLGAIDKEIYAFIYNDYMCNTLERAIVKTVPDERGHRPFPNSIRHLIPEYWYGFCFPDVAASFAPRPMILTEGGLDRDFRIIQDAYRASGHPENVTCYHYKQFQDPSTREDVESLPEGLDTDTYHRKVNVAPGFHYFKWEYIQPWIENLLGKR